MTTTHGKPHVYTTEKIPDEPAVAHFGEKHLSGSALALHHDRGQKCPALGAYYRSGTPAQRFTLGVVHRGLHQGKPQGAWSQRLVNKVLGLLARGRARPEWKPL